MGHSNQVVRHSRHPIGNGVSGQISIFAVLFTIAVGGCIHMR